MDREKVIAWLTEISLRPCDFATDDFDAYETEHLANEALEICEDAKVFNQQRNDAIALLKEQKSLLGIQQTADSITFVSTGTAQQGESRGLLLGRYAMYEWLKKELFCRGLLTDDIKAVFDEAKLQESR